MQMQQVREIARDHGIKGAKQTKLNLIRRIQQAEGNFDCFATAFDGQCDQVGCIWREDCFTQAKKNLSV